MDISPEPLDEIEGVWSVVVPGELNSIECRARVVCGFLRLFTSVGDALGFGHQ
jgi:hypothetical protein